MHGAYRGEIARGLELVLVIIIIECCARGKTLSLSESRQGLLAGRTRAPAQISTPGRGRGPDGG